MGASSCIRKERYSRNQSRPNRRLGDGSFVSLPAEPLPTSTQTKAIPEDIRRQEAGQQTARMHAQTAGQTSIGSDRKGRRKDRRSFAQQSVADRLSRSGLR